MLRALRYLIPLALFLALAWFFAVGLQRDPRAIPSPLIGKPAPAFAAPTLPQPERVVRRDDMLGKVWILNVFASWCAPCREEHPLLVDFARSGATAKTPLIGLNYKDQPEAGSRWLAQFGNPYSETLRDLDGRIGIDFGVYGVPETFVIDKAGIVRFKHVGPLNADVLKTQIQPLLRKLDG